MRIQHNISAMNSYRNLSANQSALNKNLEKLSTGYKVNRAADDAAGLAISEKMRVQISGLEAATKNAKDGISLVQTAEGALTEVHSMLNRMVSLAEQSANGTYDDEVDRTQIQKEVEALNSEINRIADSTNYNGIKLLDGSLSSNSVTGKAISTAVTGIAKSKYNSTVLHGTQGTYKTEDFVSPTSVVAGDKLSLTVNYKDRLGNDKTYTVEIAVSSSASKGTFKTSTGKIGSISSLGATNSKLATAFATIMKGDNVFADDFVATASNAALKFTAKEAGSAAATIDGGIDVSGAITFSVVSKDGANKVTKADLTQTNEASITAGVDHASAYDLKDNVWDINNKDNLTAEALASKTFTVGGKKFVIVSSGATATGSYDTSLAKNAAAADLLKEAGIDGYVEMKDNALTTATTAVSAVATATTVKSMIAVIEEKTGLDLEQGTAAKMSLTAEDIGSDWTPGSTGTATMFYVKGAVAGKADGTGGLTLQIGDTSDKFNKMTVSIDDMHAKSIGVGDVDLSTQEGASVAIDKIKNAVNTVSNTRGTLGALQNRLDHTINNLGIMRENIQSAESLIRDTDVAEEMMNYTKNNILNQSAQAMLAQANQLPQGVLQLLG